MSIRKTNRLLAAFIAIVFTVVTAQAQAPQKMSFQSVVRNSSGTLVANHTVGLRLSILKDSITGTAVYRETQTATSNANGLVTLQIGGGTIVSGTFSSINWATGAYYIKSEIDPTGGTNYAVVGTTQLLSVAYAMYANSAGNGINSIGSISSNSSSKGATINSETFSLTPADSVNGGIITNGVQSIAGSKTFKNNLTVNGLQIGANDTNSVIVGYNLGNNQGIGSVAIGSGSGQSNQGSYSIAEGWNSGQNNQGVYSVAIGRNAATNNQAQSSIAMGLSAGRDTQQDHSIAIGVACGQNTQGSLSIAIGTTAANLYQGSESIAIGSWAGANYQGQNAIAIGTNAGNLNQAPNSIVLDATGNVLNATTSGFFVAPIRGGGATIPLSYNLSTNEITYNTSDIRLKRNINPIINGLETIMKLNPVSYEKKYALNDVNYPIKENGFIAQEIQKILPNLVQEIPGKDKLLALNYIPLIPFMVKSIQELNKENEQLKAKLEKLSTEQESRIEQLEKLVKQLNNNR